MTQRIDEKDTSLRAEGHVIQLCAVCDCPILDHDDPTGKTRDMRCPAGTTTFEYGELVFNVQIVTNNLPNWRTLDPKDSYKYFERSRIFGWSSDIEDDEDRSAQTGYALLLGCDFEPDYCDEWWEVLSEILYNLQPDPFDFTIRNITKWLEGDHDWDKVDWHVQDPR
jgi:hypothetical protein